MSLYYLAMRTRPDIQVYTSFLSSRIHTSLHWDRPKEAVPFIRLLELDKTPWNHFEIKRDYSTFPYGCIGLHSGLHVTLGNDAQLHRSPFGGPIAVLSHVQKLVASSSTEAELIAVFVYHQHLLALRSLMMNLGFGQSAPSIIHQDNQAAITILRRGVFDKGSTRHLQMRIARIYELISDGIIKFLYCSTKDMRADPPSNPLHSKQDMQKLLRLCNSDI